LVRAANAAAIRRLSGAISLRNLAAVADFGSPSIAAAAGSIREIEASILGAGVARTSLANVTVSIENSRARTVGA